MLKDGFIVKSKESSTEFTGVNLGEEWAEYDEETEASCSIMEVSTLVK